MEFVNCMTFLFSYWTTLNWNTPNEISSADKCLRRVAIYPLKNILIEELIFIKFRKVKPLAGNIEESVQNLLQ